MAAYVLPPTVIRSMPVAPASPLHTFPTESEASSRVSETARGEAGFDRSTNCTPLSTHAGTNRYGVPPSVSMCRPCAPCRVSKPPRLSVMVATMFGLAGVLRSMTCTTVFSPEEAETTAYGLLLMVAVTTSSGSDMDCAHVLDENTSDGAVGSARLTICRLPSLSASRSL